ncbi:MAG: hypothetical protein QM736_23010 [Vicinamibacterales bacterium]
MRSWASCSRRSRSIASVGITGSAWIAGALDVAAATLATAVTAAPPVQPATTIEEKSGERGGAMALLGAAALAGAAFLALEVIWFRFLSMYVLVTTLAMSLMLAVVLAGIGLGGLVASLLLQRDTNSTRWLPAVACTAGLFVLLPYASFGVVTTGTQVGAWSRVLWFAIVLTLPAAVSSGVLFTLMGDVLRARWRNTSAAAGWLACANTAGAIAGPPIAAWVLLPIAGMDGALLTLALTYAAVALLASIGLGGESRFAGAGWNVRRAASAWALGIAVVAFLFGAWDQRYFLRAGAAYADDGSTIVATREGAGETLFVMQQRWLGRPVYSRLVTNGFSMSGTALQGQRYMRAFAYYPMLFHDGPIRKALVICYGVGVTVGAVTDIPSVESIDVAEISRDIVAMSGAIHEPGARPLDDPRIRLHIEDGRFFLQSTATRFDLITGEPPPPRTPGTVNIYTREYFDLVKNRLAEGGIASYWVPVARPNPGTDVNTIIRAFCDVFSDCSLWNATPYDLMLVGSRGLRGPRTIEQFTAPWQTPGLEARLREVAFERAEQIGATFIGDADYLRALTRDTPPLVDDFPQRLSPVAGRPSFSDPAYRSRRCRDGDVSVRTRRQPRAPRVRGITRDPLAVAGGARRAVAAVLRAAGDSQPDLLGRWTAAASDCSARRGAVVHEPAHAAAVDARERRGEAAYRGVDRWRHDRSGRVRTRAARTLRT